MANNVFVLDDGTKEIVCNNSFGEEIGRFHIRGGDLSILDRYNSLLADFEKIIEPLKTVKLQDDGTSSFDDDWKVVKEVEATFIQRLNDIFGTKDIGNLFKDRNAFSTIGGEFYAEKVVDMLGKVVASEMAEETRKAEARFAKYKKEK